MLSSAKRLIEQVAFSGANLFVGVAIAHNFTSDALTNFSVAIIVATLGVTLIRAMILDPVSLRFIKISDVRINGFYLFLVPLLILFPFVFVWEPVGVLSLFIYLFATYCGVEFSRVKKNNHNESLVLSLLFLIGAVIVFVFCKQGAGNWVLFLVMCFPAVYPLRFYRLLIKIRLNCVLFRLVYCKVLRANALPVIVNQMILNLPFLLVAFVDKALVEVLYIVRSVFQPINVVLRSMEVVHKRQIGRSENKINAAVKSVCLATLILVLYFILAFFFADQVVYLLYKRIFDYLNWCIFLFWVYLTILWFNVYIESLLVIESKLSTTLGPRILIMFLGGGLFVAAYLHQSLTSMIVLVVSIFQIGMLALMNFKAINSIVRWKPFF